MKRLALIAVGLGAALGVAVVAQQQPPAGQRPPVFRGTSVLVTVDAYPQRDGRIVEGLSAPDFEVLEDGKPQIVEEVEFVRVEAPLAEAARRDPNNEAEARALAADPRNRVFIVFLDAQQTSLQGSHAIRQPLIDTLNRVMAPTDLFGVMTPNLDPRHLVLGRRMLGIEEQLARYWPWGQRGRTTTDPANPIEDELFQCFNSYPDPRTGQIVDWVVQEDGRSRLLYKVLIDRNREDRTLTSIEKLVDHLAGLREARTVILLVSDGWLLYPSNQALANESGKAKGGTPGIAIGRGGQLGLSRGTDGGNDRVQCNAELMRLAGLDHQRRFRDLMARANRHNVTFYPVAPTGLSAFDVSPTTEQLDRGETGIPQEHSMERHTSRIEGLRTVADNTDGMAVVNTNDLSAGLRRVVDDVSAYYLVRYYSTNTQNDGRFRRISVKMRRPNIQVRARRGYLAPSPAPASTDAPKPKPSPAVDVTDALATLSKLGSSPELYTRGVREGNELWIAVEIPSNQANDPTWRDGAVVTLTVADGTGRPVGTALGRIERGDAQHARARAARRARQRAMARDLKSQRQRRDASGAVGSPCGAAGTARAAAVLPQRADRRVTLAAGR